MARIITINYYYSVVNFPYVDLQKFSRPFGPVIYDVTQSTDQIQKNDRTTSSLKVLISDTIPLKRTDFPKSRDKFLQALVNYDEFFKVIVKKEKKIRYNIPERPFPTPEQQMQIVLLNIKMYIQEIFKELSVLKLPNDDQQQARVSNQKYYTIVNDWDFIFEPYQEENEFKFLKDLKDTFEIDSDIDGKKATEKMDRQHDRWAYVKSSGDKVYLDSEAGDSDKYFVDYLKNFKSITSSTDQPQDQKKEEKSYENLYDNLVKRISKDDGVISEEIQNDVKEINRLLNDHNELLYNKLNEANDRSGQQVAPPSLPFDYLKTGLFEAVQGVDNAYKSENNVTDIWLKSIVPLWTQSKDKAVFQEKKEFSIARTKLIRLKGLLEKHNVYDVLSKYNWDRYKTKKNVDLISDTDAEYRKLYVYKLKDNVSKDYRDEFLEKIEFKKKNNETITDEQLIDYLKSTNLSDQKITREVFSNIFIPEGEIILRDPKTPEIFKKWIDGKPPRNPREYNMYTFPKFKSLVKFNIVTPRDDRLELQEFYKTFKNQPNVNEKTYDRYFRVPSAKQNMEKYEITLKDIATIKLDVRNPSTVRLKMKAHKCNTVKIKKLEKALSRTKKAYIKRGTLISEAFDLKLPDFSTQKLKDLLTGSTSSNEAENKITRKYYYARPRISHNKTKGRVHVKIIPLKKQIEKELDSNKDEIVKKMQEAMQEAFKKKFDQENISQDNFINTDSIIRDAINTAINNYKTTKSGNKTTAEKKQLAVDIINGIISDVEKKVQEKLRNSFKNATINIRKINEDDFNTFTGKWCKENGKSEKYCKANKVVKGKNPIRPPISKIIPAYFLDEARDFFTTLKLNVDEIRRENDDDGDD